MKPSGRTILFDDKIKSLSFHNYKEITVGSLTFYLHVFLFTHFSFIYLFLFFTSCEGGLVKVAVFAT